MSFKSYKYLSNQYTLSKDIRLHNIAFIGVTPEMLVSQFGGHASSGRTLDETFHDQEWLIDILDSAGIFTDSRSNGIESDRTTLELVDDGEQDLIVNLIKTILINIESFERYVCNLQVDTSVTFHLCKIPDTTQQGVGHTGSTS